MRTREISDLAHLCVDVSTDNGEIGAEEEKGKGRKLSRNDLQRQRHPLEQGN